MLIDIHYFEWFFLSMTSSLRIIQIIFSLFLFIISLSAFIGGYGLMTGDGLGMPKEWLMDTPFTTYYVPGLILFFIIGGSHFIAATFLIKNHFLSYYLSATAGYGLLIWIFTELYLLHQSHFLHVLYFVFGLITLIITMILLKLESKPT